MHHHTWIQYLYILPSHRWPGGAGSTETSLWTHYSAGEREYCGNAFPDGMRKNARLAQNVVTPTTKAAEGDEPISAEQIVQRGLMSRDDWAQVSGAERQ